GASNRNGFRWDEQCTVPVPKASMRPRREGATWVSFFAPLCRESILRSVLEDAGTGFKEGRLIPSFADNVGIPLAGARRLISRPRKASLFQLRLSKGKF